MNGLDTIETNAPYYDYENERLVVPRVQLASETVFDVPATGDQFTLSTEYVEAKLGNTDDGFTRIPREELAEVATLDELDYFDDVDATTFVERYSTIAGRLAEYDDVVLAEVDEDDSTRDAHLRAVAIAENGATSQVFAILVDEFGGENVFGLEPTEVDGDLAIDFRAAYDGGR